MKDRRTRKTMMGPAIMKGIMATLRWQGKSWLNAFHVSYIPHDKLQGEIVDVDTVTVQQKTSAMWALVIAGPR
jgi:hypothetical protein